MKTEDSGSSVPPTPPPTPAPRHQALSWRGFAETFVINFVTSMAATNTRNVVFKSDNPYLLCGIYACFLTLFTFLYRKFQALYLRMDK